MGWIMGGGAWLIDGAKTGSILVSVVDPVAFCTSVGSRSLSHFVVGDTELRVLGTILPPAVTRT